MKRQSGPFMSIFVAGLLSGLVALAGGLVSMPGVRAQGQPIRLVALGDSLTAGYGLPQDAAFPVVLERALRARGHNVEITNAGVSGDTSTGGLDRLDWSVPDGTDGVILELGANDMLRGVPPAQTRANLDAILTELERRGIAVVLMGMRAPPNLGNGYVAEFDAIYRDLASKHDAALVPFLIEEVWNRPELIQQDRLHPTALGIEALVAETVDGVVEALPEGVE